MDVSPQLSRDASSDAELLDDPGSAQEAFGLLFLRHGDRVYNYCFRRIGSWAAAQDCTSVVFLEAWRRRGALRVDAQSSALPWLLGVATNVSRNHTRSLRRHQAFLARTAHLSDSATAETNTGRIDDGRIDDERLIAAISGQVRNLSSGQRDVLGLIVFCQLTHSETALALGISIGTVKSRLSRALSALRTYCDAADLHWLPAEV